MILKVHSNSNHFVSLCWAAQWPHGPGCLRRDRATVSVSRAGQGKEWSLHARLSVLPLQETTTAWREAWLDIAKYRGFQSSLCVRETLLILITLRPFSSFPACPCSALYPSMFPLFLFTCLLQVWHCESHLLPSASLVFTPRPHQGAGTLISRRQRLCTDGEAGEQLTWGSMDAWRRGAGNHGIAEKGMTFRNRLRRSK